MKKTWWLALIAALVCVLTLSACEDVRPSKAEGGASTSMATATDAAIIPFWVALL